MTAARFLCADQSGCAWYRCLLPALALQRAGLDVDLGMHALVRYAPVPRGADPVVASVVELPPVVVIRRPLRAMPTKASDDRSAAPMQDQTETRGGVRS